MSPSRQLPRGDDGRSFAQAIVDTIREPLLVLDKDLRIVVASRSFYQVFQVEPQNVQGALLRELGGGEWDIPELRALLERVAPDDGVIEGFQVEREFPTIGRRFMLLNARKVFYEDHNTSSILVAIEDITDRRAAEGERDELLRQKDLLLEEMQHRIANSLQIIASILLMKARTVRSEETRTHLHDAHNRVLAVAAVQRHLQASTGLEPIQLEPYFVNLCASLAGAMIRDHDDAVKIKVEVLGGAASSGVAVSLGLIVTELVINALKHAFPVDKAGNVITVAYSNGETAWSLSVIDNGVGKGGDRLTDARIGLGTTLVSALVEQIGGRISTTSSNAGTRVTVTGGELPAAA